MAFNFAVKVFDIVSNDYIAIMNEADSNKIGLTFFDRVEISHKNDTVVAKVRITRSLVNPGELGLYESTARELNVKDGDQVVMVPIIRPRSYRHIKKKLEGFKLTKEEIYEIVKDITAQRLSDLEMAAFILSEYHHGLDMDEVEWLTRAMAESGTIINFGRTVTDKHSIGGVPGNKVSLLIVPIIAAAGLLIPKTSSKAITSASGTADTMSVLANVEFSADELKRIVNKTHGALVWGGRLNLAPADDIMIRSVERPLSVDPKGQMLASIMAKKLATSVRYLVMDLPIGPGTKLPTREKAIELGNSFLELGRRLGIQVICGVTYGGQPVGHAIGPALEAKEALQAFTTQRPVSLIEKSTHLAGLLLEIAGRSPRGHGAELAKELLTSGKAEAKFREIIDAQGGNGKIKPDDIPLGAHKVEIVAEHDGYVTAVDNAALVTIARTAGAPHDKGAGVYIYGKIGRRFSKGDVIMEIYSNSTVKLNEAYNIAMQLKPITIEGMLLEVIS